MTKRSLTFAICLFTAINVLPLRGEMKMSDPQIYQGMCDASAAVALDANLFAVANDEDNRLRVYRRDEGGLPLQTFDLTLPLGLGPRSSETDLEGAAIIGDQVYWIGSHGRNKDGKERPNRSIFFATTFKVRQGRVEMAVVGKPYRKLPQDFARDPALRALNLASASRLPPKARGGLNIEGLCATPEKQLLIGFRNPTPGGRCLLIPLKNPQELVLGRPAKFGALVLLDLEGFGIRDIGFNEGKYWIIAGHADGSGHSKLFTWAGGTAKPERVEHFSLKGLNPEAIVFYSDRGSGEFQLLSDDGSRRKGDIPCKALKDDTAKLFRSFWITP